MLATAAPAPVLSVPLIGGGTYTLADETPRHFSLIVFYRGLHCPICKTQLEEDVIPNLDAFAEAGVGVVAVSMDGEARARAQSRDWALGDLRVGYAMPEATARDWGLYLSSAREGSKEPAVFSEPGMTLVYPDGRVYAHWQQSVPFARPKMGELLKGIGFITKSDYPARGTA